MVLVCVFIHVHVNFEGVQSRWEVDIVLTTGVRWG